MFTVKGKRHVKTPVFADEMTQPLWIGKQGGERNSIYDGCSVFHSRAWIPHDHVSSWADLDLMTGMDYSSASKSPPRIAPTVFRSPLCLPTCKSQAQAFAGVTVWPMAHMKASSSRAIAVTTT